MKGADNGPKEHRMVCSPHRRRVIGHSEAHTIAGAPPPNKTCPGVRVDMAALRRRVRFALMGHPLPEPDPDSRAGGIRRDGE